MKRSTHTDAKRQDMQPVRAGLTAGSVAAMVGVLANLPLHSPSDAFFNSATVMPSALLAGLGAGLLWRALSHRRRRTIYFAAATALVFGLISIAAIAGESQMERSVSYMVPLAAIVLGLTGRPDRPPAENHMDAALEADHPDDGRRHWPWLCPGRAWRSGRAAGWSCRPGARRGQLQNLTHRRDSAGVKEYAYIHSRFQNVGGSHCRMRCPASVSDGLRRLRRCAYVHAHVTVAYGHLKSVANGYLNLAAFYRCANVAVANGYAVSPHLGAAERQGAWGSMTASPSWCLQAQRLPSRWRSSWRACPCQTMP